MITDLLNQQGSGTCLNTITIDAGEDVKM